MNDQRIGYLIKAVQQALRQRMDKALRHLDLSTSQYATLSALERSDRQSSADLARACFVTPQTMQQLVKGLERQGWIEREAHPVHGRIIQTRLTATGRARLDQAHRVVVRVESTLVEGLSEDRRARLAEDLIRCRENLD